MKYIRIIIFLLTHDTSALKTHWHDAYIQNKKFTYARLIRRVIKSPYKYWFWWRLCHEMFKTGNGKLIKIANEINKKLAIKYNVDISLPAKIGINFTVGHYLGIAICSTATIGDNVLIRQNTTIGQRNSGDTIIIGNNVDIGANTCILASNNKIGNNVKIGAMSFINKDIPDNCTYYTKKEFVINPMVI